MKTNNRLTWGLCGAIAFLTMTVATIEASLPLKPVQALPEYAIAIKQKQDKPKVVRIAGNYKTVFTPEILAEAKKEGVKSISGQWNIQTNGSFEAFLTATSVRGEVQTIRTTGKVSIINGKVVSRIETVNGVKPEKVPPTQSYTLLQDGKTLQADGQPVQLVRQ